MAWKDVPGLAPLEAPISSVPVKLPVGVPPSAVNSPEKTFTPNPMKKLLAKARCARRILVQLKRYRPILNPHRRTTAVQRRLRRSLFPHKLYR